MVSIVRHEYPATARWVTHVVLIRTSRSPWEMRNIEEMESHTSDPDKVLALVPEDVPAFIIGRRLVARVEIDGNTHQIKGDVEIGDDPAYYFIDVHKVYSRDEVSRWWNHHMMKLSALGERNSDYGIFWNQGVFLRYKPEIDVMLTRCFQNNSTPLARHHRMPRSQRGFSCMKAPSFEELPIRGAPFVRV